MVRAHRRHFTSKIAVFLKRYRSNFCLMHSLFVLFRARYERTEMTMELSKLSVSFGFQAENGKHGHHAASATGDSV